MSAAEPRGRIIGTEIEFGIVAVGQPLLSSVVILGVPRALNSGDQAEFEVGELHLHVDRSIGRDRKLLITSHVQRMDRYSHHNSR